MMISSRSFLRGLVSFGGLWALGSSEVCKSKSRKYTAKVNQFASGLGYYQFEECGETANPTIVMEVGKIYTFTQSDRSNYDYPIGFAYFPDATHTGAEELEPGVGLGSDPSCADVLTCPAPMYMVNGTYHGGYSNIPRVKRRSRNVDNYGLEEYDLLLTGPLKKWASTGEFSVKLRFDDESYARDIFYYSRVHQFMAGRIKLTSNSNLLSPNDDPPSGYKWNSYAEDDVAVSKRQGNPAQPGGVIPPPVNRPARPPGNRPIPADGSTNLRPTRRPIAGAGDLTGADGSTRQAPVPDSGDVVIRPTRRPTRNPQPGGRDITGDDGARAPPGRRVLKSVF